MVFIDPERNRKILQKESFRKLENDKYKQHVLDGIELVEKAIENPAPHVPNPARESMGGGKVLHFEGRDSESKIIAVGNLIGKRLQPTLSRNNKDLLLTLATVDFEELQEGIKGLKEKMAELDSKDLSKSR